MRAMLDKNGLTAPASHVDWATAETKLPETLAAARILGHRFLIVPWVGEEERKQSDIWQKAAALFNKAGQECRAGGIQFAYHQHGFEFVPSDALGGKLPYDYLLENTDPALVKMELDICWTVAAEQDPVAYFTKYPGRFPLVHVKDWLKDGTESKAYAGALGAGTKFTGQMANVGAGSIDWKRIFAHGGKGGRRALHRRARQPEVADRGSRRELHLLAEPDVLRRKGSWLSALGSGKSTAARRQPRSFLRA